LGRLMGQFQIRAKICVSKKRNKHSNQAQITGDFMCQKWRIYGLSDSIPLETILGIEGAGSSAYFQCFGKLLTRQDQWSFPGRVKRPPTDPVNSLLSFGYSLLTNKVASAVQLVGFDHFVGYLHSSFYGRPALALDVVEEFRPVIVDSVVLNILNHRILAANDFVVELGAYRLKPEKRTVFFTKLEERLNEEVSHPIFGYKTTYRRCLELQVRLLAKFITGEIGEYPPFLAR
jgi:CRISP-associated protein Cas1